MRTKGARANAQQAGAQVYERTGGGTNKQTKSTQANKRAHKLTLIPTNTRANKRAQEQTHKQTNKTLA